jgi:hypothetical protein
MGIYMRKGWYCYKINGVSNINPPKPSLPATVAVFLKVISARRDKSGSRSILAIYIDREPIRSTFG